MQEKTPKPHSYLKNTWEYAHTYIAQFMETTLVWT